MRDWPRSEGRTFLGEAFAFYCTAEWGFSFTEIEAAFASPLECDEDVRDQVLFASQLFGRAFQAGRVETYARPFGGGSPRLLSQDTWELDDFALRFRHCALDPERRFDPEAPPTHWLFVNSQQFNRLVDVLEAPLERHAFVDKATPTAAGPSVMPLQRDRFLRKSEVLALVPFSRSTLDDRVRRGLFPPSRNLGGGIVVWWESEILKWMAQHGFKQSVE